MVGKDVRKVRFPPNDFLKVILISTSIFHQLTYIILEMLLIMLLYGYFEIKHI